MSVFNCVSERKEEMEKCFMRRSYHNPDPNQPNLKLILTSTLTPHLKPQTNKTKTNCRRLLNVYEILEGLRGGASNVQKATSAVAKRNQKAPSLFLYLCNDRGDILQPAVAAEQRS